MVIAAKDSAGFGTDVCGEDTVTCPNATTGHRRMALAFSTYSVVAVCLPSLNSRGSSAHLLCRCVFFPWSFWFHLLRSLFLFFVCKDPLIVNCCRHRVSKPFAQVAYDYTGGCETRSKAVHLYLSRVLHYHEHSFTRSLLVCVQTTACLNFVQTLRILPFIRKVTFYLVG